MPVASSRWIRFESGRVRHSKLNRLIIRADLRVRAQHAASTALNISRMRASDTGLSTTTTSSGLLDEARTRPQVPSSTVTRTPLTVTRSRIAWPATFSPFALRGLEVLHHLVDDAVFGLVGAMRRHGRRAPGLRQRVLEVRHVLSGIAVEHVADGERGDQAVVIAAAERLVEERSGRISRSRRARRSR